MAGPESPSDQTVGTGRKPKAATFCYPVLRPIKTGRVKMPWSACSEPTRIAVVVLNRFGLRSYARGQALGRSYLVTSKAKNLLLRAAFGAAVFAFFVYLYFIQNSSWSIPAAIMCVALALGGIIRVTIVTFLAASTMVFAGIFGSAYWGDRVGLGLCALTLGTILLLAYPQLRGGREVDRPSSLAPAQRRDNNVASS